MTERALDEILRENFKRLREERGFDRQADLAAAMRDVGLSKWEQSTVAQIETGRRTLRLGELLFLQGVLNLSRGRLMGELLTTDADIVVVEGVRLRADQWQALASGSPVIVGEPEAIYAMVGRMRARSWSALTARADRFGVSEEDIWKALAAGLNDAEKRAARKLNADWRDVGLAAVGMWGQGLTEERDLRLAARTGEGDERLRRGHVTRELLVEIRQAIKNANRRRRTSK